MNGHGRFLITDKATEKLNDLLAQLGDYRIIKGDNSTVIILPPGYLNTIMTGRHNVAEKQTEQNNTIGPADEDYTAPQMSK